MSQPETDTPTNSIEEMLDMGFDEEEFVERIGFNADEEPYRIHDGKERSVAFDIIWSATDTYPPDLDDPVVDAILDDRDHDYRIELPDRETQVSPTGLAMCAWLDSRASVEVADDE